MKLSIHKAATEFGCGRDTLVRKLREAGHTVGNGAEFTLKQVHRALTGDLNRERTLKTKEERLALERERKREEKELITRMEVEQMVVEWGLRPLHDALLSMHLELDTRCNPTDPDLARDEIKAWVGKKLKALRTLTPTQ